MKINIITTTINSNKIFDSLINNILKYNHEQYTKLIVVADNKTPIYVPNTSKVNIEWYSPKMQLYWLEEHKLKYINDIIPENDPRRRNFGYLVSIIYDPDIIIVMDDDNIPFDNIDFVGNHIKCLSKHIENIVGSTNKIVNQCNFLDCNYHVYTRGYPISEYLFDDYLIKSNNNYKSILNEGLWYNKPDVDATFNIAYEDLVSSGMKVNGNFILDKDNYMPINTQNVSYTNEISKIFWNICLQERGFKRYDDIWNGIILNKIINVMNKHRISFGNPMVNHNRNSHNYNADLRDEFLGIIYNSKLFETIKNIDIDGSSYEEMYLCLAKKLSESTIKEFVDIGKRMNRWLDIVYLLDKYT